MDKSHCNTIVIKKSRIYKKTSEELLKPFKSKCYLRQVKKEKGFKRPSEASLRKYTQHHEIQLHVRNIGEDKLLLSFQQFSKQMRTLNHKHQKLISYQNEYKVKSTDLKRRLYVECQPDPIYCSTQVDEHFYNSINGRHPTRRGPYFKSLSFLYTYVMRKKLETGYRKDNIFNIDVNRRKEQEIYDMSVLTLLNQAKNFDKAMLENYEKSRSLLEKCSQIICQVEAKRFELQNRASQIFAITSKLIELDYVYKTQQKYGRFLYYLSPPIWRAQNREFAHSIEIEAKGFDFGGCNDEDCFTVFFEKMQVECLSHLTNPALYFKHPSELIHLFEKMETQQQYNFSHVLRMSQHIKSLNMGIRIIKDNIAFDTAMVENSLKGVESEVKYLYERSQHLHIKFLKILYGQFHKTVSTPEVLKFNLHLQFCFDKICQQKTIHLDMKSMAKYLEKCFMDYTFKLDGLCGKRVKQALAAYMKQEKLKDKQCLEAAKELRLFSRLERVLISALKPLPQREKKCTLCVPLTRTPIINKNIRPKTSPKCKILKMKLISESEKEYLRLFTDWIEGEDPRQYLLE